MKHLKIFIGIVFVVGVFISKNANSQTSGTLSFNVNPLTKSGSWGADHYVAIWIENSSASFVKTKLRKSDSHGTSSHLLVWKAKSTSNVVDATTGASITSYAAPINIIWNGTDVAGTVVPDGTYNVWVEFTWNHGTTGTATTSLQFTKGPSVDTQTQTANANFSGVSLTWTPNGVGIENNLKNEEISVFPNPSTGLVNINFGNGFKGDVFVTNVLGATIFNDKIEILKSGNKAIDLSRFSNGIYYINIQNEEKTESKEFKIILSK
ncbi:MAG: DUF2271 domain-containing protein [Bacteroidetes bacterium]|nr:DUF2271 domain-containing protein [Bacteroidota bacterium]